MSEPRWSEMAGAYALDALEGDEKRAFEERLAEDPELRALVDEYRAATAAAIAGALEPEAPPSALRDRVLSSARAARAPATDLGARIGDRGAPPARGPWAPWVLLAASVAGLLWLGVANRDLRQRERALATELSGVRAALGGAQADVARLDSLTQALVGTDVRFATLSGDAQPGIRLVWNADRGVLVVAATALQPAAAGRTYQLWGIRGNDAPVSLGTFDTAPGGTAVLALSPGVTPDFDVSAVTEEPTGGSPQPTTQPFLVGPWRAAQP